MMARVSVPFTEGHYYGREERPNTELAHNSPKEQGRAGKFIVDISSIGQGMVSVANQLYDVLYLVDSLSNTYIINLSLLCEKLKTKCICQL
jgi:hypothetical protein